MVKLIVASHWQIFLLRHDQSDTITVFLNKYKMMKLKIIEEPLKTIIINELNLIMERKISILCTLMN